MTKKIAFVGKVMPELRKRKNKTGCKICGKNYVKGIKGYCNGCIADMIIEKARLNKIINELLENEQE